MTFRGRLRLFFAMIVIVPMAAIAVVLFWLVGDSEEGKTDAGIATGMAVAFASYDDGRSAARQELRALASDRPLAAALEAGDARLVRRRLAALVSSHRELVSVTVVPRRGAPLRAGRPDGVAPAAAQIASSDGRHVATMTASVTDAGRLAAETARRTGLELLVLRNGRPLASSMAGVRSAPAGSGEVRVSGRDYRTRRATAGRIAGASEELVVFREQTEANGAIVENRMLIGGVLLVFLPLALASSIFVVRALGKQISGVLAAARGLAEGRLDEPVPVRGNDEFAQLGHEFNSLSLQLEEKISEIERRRDELESTIRRVGKAFATGLDPQGIFDLTVQTAVDACEADCGRAVTIDVRVVGETTVGPLDRDLEGALDESERRAGIELVQTAGQSHEREPVGLEHRGVHALSLQLRARFEREKPHFIGLISIARRGRAFSPREADLLRYLADQAVVSIENADLHDTVQRQAKTDELTGLPNVRVLHETLDREFERLRRFDVPLAFVLLDLDNFKQINDTFGHQQGDEVLARVAGVLRELTRDVDEAARYGGEEMAVVVPQTDIVGAALLAERMREAIDDLRLPLLGGDGVLRTTASFGVAAVPTSARDKPSLIAAADAALYRAKRAGKNRVECAVPEAVVG
jgi:diguanylate cyclase (GGDEF)-like protein